MKRFVAAVLGMALVGCVPGVRITRVTPGIYNLGNTKTVAVLSVKGDREGTDRLRVALQSRILRDDYYQLVVATDRRAPADAEVYVNATLTAYDYDQVKKQEGKTLKVQPEGHVTVNFQIVTKDGRVVVFRNYYGDHTGDAVEASQRVLSDKTKVLDEALDDAVRQFVRDITPHAVTESLDFDDKDQRLKPGIKLAEKEDFAGAEQAWNALLTADPNLAGAIYNLGVLSEVRREFAEAEQAYSRAISIGGEQSSLYRRALEHLQVRLAEARSLRGEL